MSDSTCGDKTSDSVRRCHQMTLTLMPNIRKDEGTGSDSSRCSACALADQTTDSNIKLEPKHQTSSDVGLSPVKKRKIRSRGGRKHKGSKLQQSKPSTEKKDNKEKSVCVECKRELPLQVVYQSTINSKQKKKKAILPSHVLNFNNMVLCPNCITSLSQQRRQDRMSECLLDVTCAAVNTTSISWQSKVDYINFHEMFEKFIVISPSHLLSDPIYREQDQHISFLTTESTPMFDPKQNLEMKKNIIGAQYPVGFDYEVLRSNILHAPETADFGFVRFTDSHDFLMISKINHSVSDVIELGKMESIYIREGAFDTRGGGAGGLVFPDNDSPSLSKCTSNSSVIIERPKSISCSVSYLNSKSIPVGYNTVCNKIRIKKIRPRSRFKNVCENEFERNILLKEMIQRLKALLIVLYLKKRNVDEDGLLSDLRAIVLSPTSHMHAFYRMGYSYFQSLLLTWGIEGEESRNHQQLKAHVDGNKKNAIETLSLFPRIAESKVVSDDSFDNKFYSGLIYFPTHGFSISIGCGTDIINCSLRETVHIPDGSRNYKNWSKVNRY